MKFQDDISNMNTYIRTYIHTYIHTDKPKPICPPPPTFSKLGHKKEMTRNSTLILSFLTDRIGQIVNTQIKLIQEEQSDQGCHCLLFCLHLFQTLVYMYGNISLLEF